MRYHRLGELPAKRHTQFRDANGSNGGGRLLVEEVMGYEGFSGNESILYHVESPCRIAEAGEFTPIEHERVGPRRARPPPSADRAGRGRAATRSAAGAA